MNFLPSHDSVFWFDCSPVFKLESILVALLITGVGKLFHWLVNHILKHLQWNLDYNEEPRDWQKLFFAITRFRYIEILFHRYYYILTVVTKIVTTTSLYRGSTVPRCR